MIEIKAPNILQYGRSLFLAGSIDMGEAVNWQNTVVDGLKNTDWIIYNPRRDDWDSSWRQNINDQNFRRQVAWELSAQESAKTIAMYFDPGTKAPISLLELGLFARSQKMIVCCPEGYWRKGNVDVVCERYGVGQVDTLNELISVLKRI